MLPTSTRAVVTRAASARRARGAGPTVLTDEMFTPAEDENRRLLRARDAIDREYSAPLDVPSLAAVAYMSPAHFARRFRAVFGETPYRYLQRRRIERACALLRDTSEPVTDVARTVGYDSLGTFSRTFTAVVGRSPTRYRQDARPVPAPVCFTKAWTRPSSFGEASPAARP